MKLFFLKDTLKKTAGIVIISAGTLLLFIAVFGVVSGLDKGVREDINTGLIIGAFSLAIIIPGVRLYISGAKLSKLEENLKQLASLVKTYRRISISEIAKKLNVNEMEAEKLLNTAIDLDLISGNMDRTTGEFFISESLEEIKKISFCPNCGASLTQVIHKGETAKCYACGSMFN
ncbi:MAG TPA: PCI domain-containing protein [Spirochaetota bacterium]|nr:PCI domain-containing protein [Spirochaetota bacterium]